MGLREIFVGATMVLTLAACSGSSEEETTSARDASAGVAVNDEAAVAPAKEEVTEIAPEVAKAPQETVVEEKAPEPEPTSTSTSTSTVTPVSTS